MSASGRGSALAAVLVVALAVAAVLLPPTGDVRPFTTSLSAEVPAGMASSGEPVTRTVLRCPDYESPSGVVSGVRVGLARADERLGAGSVRRGEVGKGSRTIELSRGDLVDLSPDGGPTVVGTGGSAAGLFGFRADRRTSGVLALAPCVAPRADWWFTGAGGSLDHSSSLLLTNVDPGPAVVDLRVLGPAGEVETVGTTGITLAPDSGKRIDLADIAPQTDELSLEVHAGRGRVAASVIDSARSSASAVPGQEWLAGTDRPSRAFRLGGLPTGAASPTLLVANPSDLEAVVTVRVAGRSGTFTPAGLEPVNVPPGGLEKVDLRRTLPSGEPVAVVLRSRVPVVASVRFGGGADHAYGTAVAPLTGPAAAPVPRGVQASVQLTAGRTSASAEAAAFDATGRVVGRSTLSVPASGTRAWSPPRAGAYVTVTPQRGTVSGAVAYTGAGLAAVPLTDLPIRVDRPSVRPALR
jgi:Family of unknown function (DUF5719)